LQPLTPYRKSGRLFILRDIAIFQQRRMIDRKKMLRTAVPSGLLRGWRCSRVWSGEGGFNEQSPWSLTCCKQAKLWIRRSVRHRTFLIASSSCSSR